MKSNILVLIIFSIFSFNFMLGGCGSCNTSKKKPISPIGNFVTSINDNGEIEGLVLASCGLCNFGMKNKKTCSLAIQINQNAYDVNGTGIDDHGDSHAKDGFCNAIRIANVKGKVKNTIFESSVFNLLDE